jgi:hypothetical protein
VEGEGGRNGAARQQASSHHRCPSVWGSGWPVGVRGRHGEGPPGSGGDGGIPGAWGAVLAVACGKRKEESRGMGEAKRLVAVAAVDRCHHVVTSGPLSRHLGPPVGAIDGPMIGESPWTARRGSAAARSGGQSRPTLTAPPGMMAARFAQALSTVSSFNALTIPILRTWTTHGLFFEGTFTFRDLEFPISEFFFLSGVGIANH